MPTTRFNLFLPDRQLSDLRFVAGNAGVSVAELFRRMADHCLREQVLNELIPPMSGHISVRGFPR